MSNEARDYECVYCPECKHQFRGLSDSDETHIADLTATQAKLEAENAKLEAVLERMLPKLREHLTEEYIYHELLKGER